MTTKEVGVSLYRIIRGMKLARKSISNFLPENTVKRICTTYLAAYFLLIKAKKFSLGRALSKTKILTKEDTEQLTNTKFAMIKYVHLVTFFLSEKRTSLKPFWNERCLDVSKDIWLPIETSSKIQTTIHNSWFSVETEINPLSKNTKPTYLAITSDNSKKEEIRARKIRLYPTLQQRKIMTEWIGTARYVYNKALEHIKQNGNSEIDAFKLRNKFVTEKNNPLVEKWQTNTPKDIRAGAIRDLVKAYKTAFSQLNSGTVGSFNIGFRSKKTSFSLEINHRALKIVGHSIRLYPRFFGDNIKTSKDKCLKNITLEYDCRLQIKHNIWYIIIPVKRQVNEEMPVNQYCALDSGVRKMQTVYAEDKTQKIIPNRELIHKLQVKLDIFRSLRARKQIESGKFKRRERKIYHRLDCLIDDMHYKTISSLTKSYNCIFFAPLESQEMVQRNRYGNRDFLQMKHYLFKLRLQSACALKRNTQLVICTEEYTSKTCTACGVIKYNLGNAEIYSCDNQECGLVIDRDINGARNIFVKTICGL